MERIYNITAAVETGIALAWAKEAVDSFLPALRSVPGVLGVELIEVPALPEANPEEGRTYTVQIRFTGQEPLDAFLGEAERKAERTLYERFGQKYLTFRLILRSLHRL